MAPDKDGKASRDEYEVAYYTKELGRPLQRKLLQRRLDEIGERQRGSAGAPAAHGDEAAEREDDGPPEREDRAG